MPRKVRTFIAIILYLFVASWALYAQSEDRYTQLTGISGFLSLLGGSLVNPKGVFSLLKSQMDQSVLSNYGWLMTIGYSTLYAQTALILGLRGAEPAFKPFIPIPEKKYYLAQSGFTVPVGTAAIAAGFGVSFGFARVFGSDVNPVPLWAAFSTAMVAPTVITMWLPETIAGLFAKNPTGSIPEGINNWRQLIGLGWMIALSCAASAFTADMVWWQSIITGVVSTSVTCGVMILFLR
ncbi:MAG: hypothetical protein ACLFST_13235 [Spirochaetia bacterium]